MKMNLVTVVIPARLSRRRNRVVAGTTAALLAAALCAVSPGVASAESTGETVEMSDDQINQSLSALARDLAGSMKYSGVRSEIHEAVAKKFDGDTNALWKTLAKSPTFAQKVGASRASGESMATEAAKMPQLQVAVPEHFEDWDPTSYAPLVAFFPEGVDDTKVKTITAYRPSGAAVTLDAQNAPEQPVIVVSLNERVDRQGRVPSVTPEDSVGVEQIDAETMGTAATRYSVNIVYVYLADDKEPWAKGDAEISMRASSRPCKDLKFSLGNWSGLNDSGDWYLGPKQNLGTSGCDVVVYWWEDDGGRKDYTLSWDKFSLGVGMDDRDDRIGGTQLKHSTFPGGSTESFEWNGLLRMWWS